MRRGKKKLGRSGKRGLRKDHSGEIEEAIFKTLAYADVFAYPLRANEIYRYLIASQPVAKGTVFGVLETMRTSKKRIQTREGYFFLVGREETVILREKRKKWSRTKMKKARKIATLLKVIPTVKLVGVSGGLAMENADRDDDIDLFIVTSAGRLWLTRFLVTVLVELTGQRRKPLNKSEIRNPKHKTNSNDKNSNDRNKNVSNCSLSTRSLQLEYFDIRYSNFKDKICLNMFVDENHLAIPPEERNLFTAHEVVQMKPLWERDDAYQRFLGENRWVRKYLPKAMVKLKVKSQKLKVKSDSDMAKWLDGLERFLMNLQLKYMARRRTTEKISPGRILFHPEDKGKWVMREYQKRL